MRIPTEEHVVLENVVSGRVVVPAASDLERVPYTRPTLLKRRSVMLQRFQDASLPSDNTWVVERAPTWIFGQQSYDSFGASRTIASRGVRSGLMILALIALVAVAVVVACPGASSSASPRVSTSIGGSTVSPATPTGQTWLVPSGDCELEYSGSFTLGEYVMSAAAPFDSVVVDDSGDLDLNGQAYTSSDISSIQAWDVPIAQSSVSGYLFNAIPSDWFGAAVYEGCNLCIPGVLDISVDGPGIPGPTNISQYTGEPNPFLENLQQLTGKSLTPSELHDACYNIPATVATSAGVTSGLVGLGLLAAPSSISGASTSAAGATGASGAASAMGSTVQPVTEYSPPDPPNVEYYPPLPLLAQAAPAQNSSPQQPPDSSRKTRPKWCPVGLDQSFTATNGKNHPVKLGSRGDVIPPHTLWCLLHHSPCRPMSPQECIDCMYPIGLTWVCLAANHVVDTNGVWTPS